MNNFNKTILSWSIIVLVIILAVFLVVSTNQKLNTATTTNTMSFSGEGKVSAKPDVAVIDLSILTQGPTSKAAQDENSGKSQKVTDFLKGQKIDDKDVKTVSYNIYPQYYYPKNGSPEITGYQVNEMLEVKVRDLNIVGAVLDGVVSAGANQVNSFSFQIDNPDKLKAQARTQAIADAKAKANELRGQLGIDLGKIVNFSEGVTGYPMPLYEKSSAIGLGGGSVVPSVPTGENEVTVDVTITYQIK